jgi:riboflavin transporter FmnP
MTVYLKSGVVGIVILLVTILLLFRFRKANNPVGQRINYLLTGTAIFLFISYWVFMGYYFKADTKAILIGLLLAYSERLTNKY